MNLKTLSDDQLIECTSRVVDSERRITADAIKHFFEINQRKLYLKMGYGSLFEMLRKHFGYCEPTAHLRKNAVYLMQDVPTVIRKIESGEMPVTVAANIQSFLYHEKKLSRPYSQEAKLELVEACTDKSVLAANKEFVRRNPEIEARESVRHLSEDRVRVSHSMSTELEEKIQKIKMLWSHIDPNMSREDVLNRMADITLNQIDPLRKATRAEARAKKRAATPATECTRTFAEERAQTKFSETSLRAPEAVDDQLRVPEVKTRYISEEENQRVWRSNEDLGCEFVSKITGKRCGSKHQLQARSHRTVQSGRL